MHSFFTNTRLFLSLTSALFLAACSENRQPAPQAAPPTPPESRPNIAKLPETVPPAEDPKTPEPPAPISPQPDPPADANEIERRFLAAQNDPTTRIAAIRDLANATPIAAVTTLNRLFAVERRQDVKAEMLAALSEMDHSKERDNQLALCTKALAPNQPTRIRYIALQTLAELQDPRARAILLPLKNDPDPQIQAAAKQALTAQPQ